MTTDICPMGKFFTSSISFWGFVEGQLRSREGLVSRRLVVFVEDKSRGVCIIMSDMGKVQCLV